MIVGVPETRRENQDTSPKTGACADATRSKIHFGGEKGKKKEKQKGRKVDVIFQ
jgi:hypothetical protein